MKKTHWHIFSRRLLTCLVLSNDTNFQENINEDIPTQARTVDSTTEDIRQSSPDRTVVNTYSNTVRNIATVGSSTASAIQTLAGNIFQPVSSFSSVHDSQYYENTRGNNPIQSTRGDYNSSVTDTFFSSPVYNLKTDGNSEKYFFKINTMDNRSTPISKFRKCCSKHL